MKTRSKREPNQIYPTGQSMKNPNRRDRWWRIPLLPDTKGKRILDPTAWQERWKGKQYKTPPIKRILSEIRKANGDSKYIEWLLMPEYLKGTPGYPDSRLPEETQQKITALFDELDGLLRKMREMVETGHLPGRPVENFRQWLLCFEKEVEPACPKIGGYPAIQRKLRKERPHYFRGRQREERVFMAFLISEELRDVFPRQYWRIVADLLKPRFPNDKAWCTPQHLSRAVGLFKRRAGKKEAGQIVEAYRLWFNESTPKPGSVIVGRSSF
jgi:hypothetical protein